MSNILTSVIQKLTKAILVRISFCETEVKIVNERTEVQHESTNF